MLAHHSVGNVLGNPFYLNLLRPSDAERHYREALALAETLQAEDRKNMLARIDVATSSWRLGAVIARERSGEAARLHRRAIDLTREVLAVSPNHTGYRRIQVFNFLGLGHALIEARELAGAREAFGEALALSQAVSAQDPAQRQFTHDLPIALHGLALVALARGDLAEADSRLEAALAIAEPSAREHAQDLSCHRYLADCYEALGAVHRRRGNAPKGRVFNDKAAEVWQQWLDRGVDNPYLRARLSELRNAL
jgi:tetratricopeptide (TPR) repeat protein